MSWYQARKHLQYVQYSTKNSGRVEALKNVHGMVHSEFAKARRTIMPSQTQ